MKIGGIKLLSQNSRSSENNENKENSENNINSENVRTLDHYTAEQHFRRKNLINSSCIDSLLNFEYYTVAF